MKKKLLLLLLSVIMACSVSGFTVTFAESSQWTAVNGATVSEDNSVKAGAGTSLVEYVGKLNLKTGAAVKFQIDDCTPSADCKEYMSFKFMNGEKGMEIKAYPLFEDATSTLKRKIRWDINYISPDFNDGVYYAESLWTYKNVFGRPQTHSIDVQYYLNSYYVTVDGETFTPKHNIDKFDFSDCTLTIATQAESVFEYKIVSVTEEVTVLDRYGWMNLGSVESIRNNADGTVTYDKIDRELTADHNGTEHYFCRNYISSTKGYDVTQPIEIIAHYDTSATPGVWWGLGFAGKPFENITTLELKANGTIKTGYGSGDMQQNANKGIMFQTTTGKAEPSWSNADENKKSYPDNGGGKSYNSLSMLNTVTLEIGEESTVVYWNGRVLWDNYQMKRSDFKDGVVYPYFKFIETPANMYKDNTITIKGINTPKAETAEFKRLLSSTGDITLNVNNQNNGKLSVADADRNLVSEDKYSYDAESGVLTLKADLFNGLGEGEHIFFAVNDGGYEQLKVRIAAQFEQLEKAVLEPAELNMKPGTLTEDFILRADLKNGSFKSFSGSGLFQSQFTLTEEENNVILIKISKDFLNSLGERENAYVIKLTTQNEDGETVVSEFTVKVGETSQGSDSEDSAGGSDKKPSPSSCGSCGSSMGVSLGAVALLSLVIGAKSLKKRS